MSQSWVSWFSRINRRLRDKYSLTQENREKIDGLFVNQKDRYVLTTDSTIMAYARIDEDTDRLPTLPFDVLLNQERMEKIVKAMSFTPEQCAVRVWFNRELLSMLDGFDEEPNLCIELYPWKGRYILAVASRDAAALGMPLDFDSDAFRPYLKGEEPTEETNHD